jgi:hypothetical protein
MTAEPGRLEGSTGSTPFGLAKAKSLADIANAMPNEA